MTDDLILTNDRMWSGWTFKGDDQRRIHKGNLNDTLFADA